MTGRAAHALHPNGLAQCLRRQTGFTLIELLAVIVIVAILFTFATLAIRGHEPDELIRTEARRLHRLVELALEEAILRGEDYALEFDIDGYRFLHFREKQWLPLESDRILRARQLPEGMEVELDVEDTTVRIGTEIDMGDDFSLESTVDKFAEKDASGKTVKKADPQVFLLSSGEISPPFSVRFFYPDVETSYQLNGRFDGQLVVETGEI